MSRLLSGLVIFAALGIIAMIKIHYPYAVISSVILLGLSLARILCDPSKYAGVHHILASRYRKFERALLSEDQKKLNLEKLREQIVTLYEEEPPRRTLVHALAYNDMACWRMRGTFVPEYRLTLFQRLFAHLIDGVPMSVS
jgi:hypothetical protein